MSNLKKFLFYFALAAVAVGGVGAGYSAQMAYYGRIQDKLLNEFFAPAQKMEAQYIASKLEDRMNGIISVLKTTAAFPELENISKQCTAGQTAVIERAIVALKDSVDYVALFDKNGTVVCAPNWPPLVGVSTAEYPHIKEVIATHRMAISRAVVNPLGVKLIAVVVPVFDKKGEFAGILGGAIRLEGFKKELESFPAVTPSAYNVLDDDDGTILVHPRAEFEMKNTMSEEIQKAIGFDPDLNNAYRKMFAGETGYSFYTFQGEKKIVGYAPAKILDGNRFFTVSVTAKMAEYGYIGEKFLFQGLLINLGILFSAAALILIMVYLRDQYKSGGERGGGIKKTNL